MTNGEKMRKMTDKELAEKITSLIYNAIYGLVLDGNFTYQQMLDSNLEWLEKEVDESD
jgi:hypothetical protein